MFGYHAYDLALHRTDIRSTVSSETTMGITTASLGSLLTTNDNADTWQVVSRIPRITVWTWINFFLGDLSNQSQTKLVPEDSLTQ